MSERRLSRLGCILLLLFAQQTALTHAIWHGSGQGVRPATAHEHVGGGDAQDTETQSELCVFHYALGEVSGGGCGATAQSFAVDARAELHLIPLVERMSVEAIHPASRGPPVLP